MRQLVHNDVFMYSQFSRLAVQVLFNVTFLMFPNYSTNYNFKLVTMTSLWINLFLINNVTIFITESVSEQSTESIFKELLH